MWLVSSEPERSGMRTSLIALACVFTLIIISGCGDDECDPCAPIVPAQPLAQLDLSMGGGASTGTDTLRILFVSSENDTLFDMLLTLDDDGTTKTLDADGYPNFADAALRLSDGVDDNWMFWTRLYPSGSGGGTGTSESNWLDGGLTREYDPDLYGAEITKALIHLDEVYVNNQGGWTDYSIRAQLVIIGKP